MASLTFYQGASLSEQPPTVSTDNALAANSNHKRKRGTGFTFLESELSNQSDMSGPAKTILKQLLSEHKINIEVSGLTPFMQPLKVRKPIDTNMSDERVMQLAQEGELSFLASLLRIIEEEQGSVTTKFLIKACCLSVEPGKVPAVCDGKEMVMTALHFMSQTFQVGDEFYPILPLLQSTSANVDLEKRAYVKAGEWKLQDLLPQVLHLEEIFYESCKTYTWMAREHACPKLTSGRDLLLLKGSAPSSCTAKPRKTVTGVQRKKVTPKAAEGIVKKALAKETEVADVSHEQTLPTKETAPHISIQEVEKRDLNEGDARHDVHDAGDVKNDVGDQLHLSTQA